MIIEFLGSRLSHCASLAYFGSNGLFYFASKTGDSYILQILATRKEPKPAAGDDEVNPEVNPELGADDRPYINIVQEHQSLAPVIDMKLRDSSTQKPDAQSKKTNIQNELIVVSGSNYTSRVNVIRKGVAIKEHLSLSQLPPIEATGGLHCFEDKLAMKLLGINALFLARVEI